MSAPYGSLYNPRLSLAQATDPTFRYTQIQQRNWDPNTFMPSGPAPTADQAIESDWQSQRLYQQARHRYFQDALGSNAQALQMLGQYRPGGGAMAASNVMQNRGSMQFNMGNSLERPDMFANKREAAVEAAADAARNASNMALVGGVIAAAGTVAGAVFGGPAGAAAGGAAGAAIGGAVSSGAQQQAQQAQQAADLSRMTDRPSQPSGGPVVQPLGGTPVGGGMAGGSSYPARSGSGGGQAQPGQGPQGAQGATPTAAANPLQVASTRLAAKNKDDDFMERAFANNNRFLARIPGIRKPPPLYDRLPAKDKLDMTAIEESNYQLVG